MDGILNSEYIQFMSWCYCILQAFFNHDMCIITMVHIDDFMSLLPVPKGREIFAQSKACG